MSKNKRLKCKVCKKRVNLQYQEEGNKISFMCPKCNSHGEFFIRRRKWKNY